MAYSVLKGKLTGKEAIPPEEPEEQEAASDSPHEVSLPLKSPCPHGFYRVSACYQCNPIKDDVPKGKYLPAPSQLYDDVYPWDHIKVGAKMCRRIRTQEVGVVTNITYVFSNSKHIREIWIDFCDSGRSTPYTPDELLLLKVQ